MFQHKFPTLKRRKLTFAKNKMVINYYCFPLLFSVKVSNFAAARRPTLGPPYVPFLRLHPSVLQANLFVFKIFDLFYHKLPKVETIFDPHVKSAEKIAVGENLFFGLVRFFNSVPISTSKIWQPHVTPPANRNLFSFKKSRKL